MIRLKKFVVLMVLLSPIFMTGCDASKVLQVIQGVAQGIQQAIPAIQQVVNGVQGAINGTTPTTATNTNTTPTTTTNTAGTTVIPSATAEDLTAGSAGAAVGSIPALKRPTGRAEIEQIFGKPGTNQVTVQMAAGPNGSMKRVTCHKLIASRMKAVFDEIKAKGLSKYIKSYDGCFVNRNKRGGSNPSTHAWGIAIDINASANPMGSSKKNAEQQALAAVFAKYGFYQLPNDLMHFQYCRGY